jgi:hypothetical protein
VQFYTYQYTLWSNSTCHLPGNKSKIRLQKLCLYIGGYRGTVSVYFDNIDQQLMQIPSTTFPLGAVVNLPSQIKSRKREMESAYLGTKPSSRLKPVSMYLFLSLFKELNCTSSRTILIILVTEKSSGDFVAKGGDNVQIQPCKCTKCRLHMSTTNCDMSPSNIEVPCKCNFLRKWSTMELRIIQLCKLKPDTNFVRFRTKHHY